MTMDIERWLDTHTFRCRKLSARISPAQCDFNRQGVLDDSGLPFVIPACRECPDWITARLAEPWPPAGAPAPDSPAAQGFDFWTLTDPGRPRLPARLRSTALAGSAGFMLTTAAVRRFSLRCYRSVRLFAAPEGVFVAQFLKPSARTGDPDVYPVLRQPDGLRLPASGLVCESGAFGRYEVEGGHIPEAVLTLRPLAAPPAPHAGPEPARHPAPLASEHPLPGASASRPPFGAPLPVQPAL
jgi:hypothetical protein